MGNFEDFVVSVRAVAGAIGKKTGQIVDISKLKLTQSEINNEISNYFKELGRITYQAQKSEDVKLQERIDEYVSLIDDLNIRLRSVTEQIAHLKNKKTCKNCMHENGTDMLYCGKCGEKISDIDGTDVGKASGVDD